MSVVGLRVEMSLFRSKLLILTVALFHALSGTSMASAMFAMLAEMNPEHAVQVVVAESGVKVILHHTGQKTPLVEDHRAPLSRALASVCRLDGAGDHLLSVPKIASVRLETEKTHRHFPLAPAMAALPLSPAVILVAPKMWATMPAVVLDTRLCRPAYGLGTVVLLI